MGALKKAGGCATSILKGAAALGVLVFAVYEFNSCNKHRADEKAMDKFKQDQQQMMQKQHHDYKVEEAKHGIDTNYKPTDSIKFR